MDEAERCHKLAYIAYGRLLATGTADEVIAGQGLTTLAVYGPDLSELQTKLRKTSGVEQTVMFGTVLHASAHDEAALEKAVSSCLGAGCRMEPISTGLEDVFIYMMAHSRDNFGSAKK